MYIQSHLEITFEGSKIRVFKELNKMNYATTVKWAVLYDKCLQGHANLIIITWFLAIIKFFLLPLCKNDL